MKNETKNEVNINTILQSTCIFIVYHHSFLTQIHNSIILVTAFFKCVFVYVRCLSKYADEGAGKKRTVSDFTLLTINMVERVMGTRCPQCEIYNICWLASHGGANLQEYKIDPKTSKFSKKEFSSVSLHLLLNAQYRTETTLEVLTASPM